MLHLSLLLLVPPPAQAALAPDLTTAFAVPAGYLVEDVVRYEVRVTNGGNKDAGALTVTVNLPATHTSPQVYVLGELGARATGCTLSGTKITCAVSGLKKGKTTSVWFDYAARESTSALAFTSTAATAGETNTSNNGASYTAAPANYAVSFTGARDVWNDHCTGTGLTAFYECELFPSSISGHDARLEDGGAVSFPSITEPGYAGAWAVSGDELWFEYTYFGDVIAEFVGYGVPGDCWEGVTTFPGSAYVSPYQVCLQ